MPNYWIDHIHLMSPDPLETAEFYEKMFGARKVMHDLGNGRTLIEVNISGTAILISKPATDPSQFGLAHFGLATDDLNEAVEELKAKGVEFTRDIREIKPGFKVSFLLGKENVPIELQEGGL